MAETVLYGQVSSAYRGIVGSWTTFAAGANDQHAGILGSTVPSPRILRGPTTRA